MSITDIAIISSLIFLIPKLVENYLGEFNFRSEVRLLIVFGGMFWMVAACYSGDMYRLMGLHATDGNLFERWAYQKVWPELERNNYEVVFRWLLSPGRWFYVALQGILYYFTGCTVASIQVLNGFLAYWGGLVLARLVYCTSVPHASKSSWPVFCLVFAPSVLFWCSNNLKEGLIYWSICHVFAFVVPPNSSKRNLHGLVWFFIGTIIGACIRPHIIFSWAISVIFVKMFQKGFYRHGLIIFLVAPLFLGYFEERVSINSFEQNIFRAENKMKIYIQRGKPSTFDYGKRGPIPVMDGAVNTLFRPFIWRVRNLRSLVSALEIWTISIVIFFVWMRMSNAEWKFVVRNSSILAALLVCIPFFFFFTYTVNEGLLVRQRVQLFPALLTLLAMPILHRRKGVTPSVGGSKA